MKSSKNNLIGGALRPNAGIASDYAKPIVKEIGLMSRDVERQLKRLFTEPDYGYAMDASISSQARILLNYLMDKWQKRFKEIAEDATDRMIKRTVKNSSITLGISLKELSENFEIDTSVISPKIRDVIKASSQEAANLIKLIPQKYLGDVQGAVMRSITTGKGLRDLVPFLEAKYNGNLRHAKNVALDQTRKTYQAVTRSRLQSLGVKKFKWVHSGGGREPRQEHIRMSGKEYLFDNPPEIGIMYGETVRGFPGELPNCRCTLSPVIDLQT